MVGSGARRSMDESRRNFLKAGTLFSAALFLPADAIATEASGDSTEIERLVKANERHMLASAPAPKLVATEDNILGPYYRQGAPYRAKITPLGEPGTPLLVKGSVWSLKTKKPLPGAVVDVWQANAKGRYDNDDRLHPPVADSFVNRARLVTDEKGYYEFETIHPGQYRISETVWRPSHIHYMVVSPDHKTLVTQLYFHGDPHIEKDQFVKNSLIRTPAKQTSNGVPFELITFDIVLA